MADLEFQDAYLGSAARLLTAAASEIRSSRVMPMLSADSYTGIGQTVGNFMRTVRIAAEALADAAGESAASVACVMSSSTQVEQEISQTLGPGFTN